MTEIYTKIKLSRLNQLETYERSFGEMVLQNENGYKNKIIELAERCRYLEEKIEHKESIIGYLEEFVEFCNLCKNPKDDCIC